MNVTTTVLVIALLTCLSSTFLPGLRPPESLEPLDESQIEVHWISKDEPAPFDGLLMNDYTYERMRLKLIEGD